jgi:SAM-dependent methyltransferase
MTRTTEKKQLRIIEFGCATGLLLSMLKRDGYMNLTGVDPSAACTLTAEKHYGIQVVTSAFSDFEAPDGSYDLVIIVGVLEHVRNIGATLSKIWRLLAPNGKLFIGVPDASQYLNGADAPFQEFSIEHINYFGPQSLENVLNRYHFDKIHSAQIPIEVNYNTITPNLFALFQKRTDLLLERAIKSDDETRRNLSTYISNCRSKELEVDQIIGKLVSDGAPILIWGTGAQTMRLMENSQLSSAKIAAFVDSNPKYQGKSIKGIPVVSPSSIKDENIAILVCTRAYQDAIERQIKDELKLKNRVVKLY